MHSRVDDEPVGGSPRATEEGIPLSNPDANAWLGELMESSFWLEFTPDFGEGLIHSEIHNSFLDPEAPDPNYSALYPASSNTSSVTVQFRSDTDTLHHSSCSIISNDSTIVGAGNLAASSVRTIKKCSGNNKGKAWWRKFLFVPWSSSRRKTAPTIDLTSVCQL